MYVSRSKSIWTGVLLKTIRSAGVFVLLPVRSSYSFLYIFKVSTVDTLTANQKLSASICEKCIVVESHVSFNTYEY
jgi:hypothetical protein